MNESSVITVKMAVRRIAQTDGLFEHCLEHRREIAGRSVDNLKHLGGCGLLRQCLVAFRGTIVELTLEFRDDLFADRLMRYQVSDLFADLVVTDFPSGLYRDRAGPSQIVDWDNQRRVSK